MYNPEIIFSRLEKIQKALKLKLIEYSIKESLERKSAIDSLINLDLYKETSRLGKKNVKIEFKSKRAEAEFNSPIVQSYIQNELLLCKWNCNYWMDRYYWISDIEGRWTLFSPLPAQKINRKVRSKLEFLKRAIRRLCLKARQQGETTDAQGVVQHRIQFHDNTRSLIASKSEDDTNKMSQKIMKSMERQPFWLRPQLLRFDTGNYFEFENDSYLDLGWGTQKSLGRGGTYQVNHISEIASFKYPYSAIDSALGLATHETIWMLQTLEGTAEGRDDYLHELWKETISGMEKGISSLYATFFPYYLRRDIYPTETWIQGRREGFLNWIPKQETIIHARKAENNVRTNSYLREELGSNWKMDKEVMFFYEISKEAAIKRNELPKFLQEMPADAEEAFQHAGKTIYPIELITFYSDSAQSKTPDVYKIRGDSAEISPDFFPLESEIDSRKKIIQIKVKLDSEIPTSYYELVPIKFNGWNDFDPINKFLIWEHPKSKFEYGAFIDPSDGMGKGNSDDAVFNITRKGTIEQKDKQVLEFASPDLPQLKMWPFILPLISYFSLKEQLLLTIEINKGYELQNLLWARGWNNMFKRYDEGKKGQELAKIKNYGLYTSPRTREQLVTFFNSFVLGKHYEINSLFLIQEMKDLQKIRSISPIYHIQKDKISGKKDNRFIAAAGNLYALHRDEILGFEKASWENRILNENHGNFEFKSIPEDSFSKEDSFESNLNCDNISNIDDEISSLFSFD